MSTLQNTLTTPAPRTQSPRGPLSFFTGEGSLVAVGLLGVLLSAALALFVWLTGVWKIGAEGYVLKAIQFDLALGLFTINTAAILPMAGFRPAAHKVWRRFTMVLALYAYGAETVQVLRGIDPRFSHQFHSLLEALPNILFGLVSMLIIVVYVVLAVRLLLNRRSEKPLHILALRYGVASTLVAFAGGVWMIAVGGRHVGAAGNLIWLHFFGIVGMKMLWATGYLAQRSTGARPAAVHTAGIAWLLVCAMVAWQTQQGFALTALTPALLGGLAAVAVWAAVTVRLLLRQQNPSPLA